MVASRCRLTSLRCGRITESRPLVVFALDLRKELLPPEYAGIGCRFFDLNEGNIIFEGKVARQTLDTRNAAAGSTT